MTTRCSILSSFTFLLLFAAPLFTQAQQKAWDTAKQFPAEGRDHPVGFAIRDTGYVLTGKYPGFRGSNYLNDFYRYVPENNEWQALSPFPGPARGFSIGITYAQRGYIGFGGNSNGLLKDVWEYNPNSDSWRQLPEFPGPPRRHPAMEAGNGKLYVGLGDTIDYDRRAIVNLKDWWAFDLEKGTWERMPDLPGPPRHHPYHFTINGVLYAGMGHGPGIYDDWYRYDKDTDSWEQLQDFPGEGRVAGTQFAHSGKGYVLSGDGADHSYMPTGEFWRYDPEKDEWTSLPPHPGVSLWAPTNFVVNDKLMMIGGLNRKTDTRDQMVYAYQLPSTVGVAAKQRKNAELNLYPNPVATTLQFDWPNKAPRQVQVLNLQGQVVKTTTNRTNHLNVTNLGSGVYFFRIQDQSGNWHHQRFIKQ